MHIVGNVRPVAEFGDLLRRLRTAAGQSQQTLAERSHMSVEAIGALERGVRRAPQQRTLALLIEALALGPDEIAELEAAAEHGRVRTRSRGPETSSRDILPAPATSFVGRATEVRKLGSVLLGDEHRIITITGPGGVGKSRLSLEILRQLESEFPDGVYVVALAGVSDPLLVLSAITDALGLPKRRDRQVEELLRGKVRDLDAVILLDNCEHLIDSVAEAVTLIVAACPNVRVLATSRERLSVPGEFVFLLTPLEFPVAAPSTPEAAAEYPAIRLLLDRAKIEGYDLQAGNVEPILEIVRRLDGLPLAIELVAPLLRILLPSELAQRLTYRFALLARGHRGSLPRHRSLRAMVDWSYEQLSDEERLVFRHCSIFAGSFSLDAVVAVCGDDRLSESQVVNAFTSLVEKSLVSVSAQAAGRYRMLEVIKEYAREWLDEAGEGAALSLKHTQHFIEIARNDRAKVYTDSSATDRPLKLDAKNLEAALSWSILARGNPELGAELITALDVYFVRESYLRSRHWFERAIDALDRETHPELFARLVITLAFFTMNSPDIVALLPELETAVAICRKRSDPKALSDALDWLAFALASGGDFLRAREAGEESVVAAREAGPMVLSVALRFYASVAQDDLQLQRELLEQSLALFSPGSPDIRMVGVLSNLGEVAFLSGDVELAIAKTREAIELERSLSWFPLETGVAARLGSIAGYELSRGGLETGLAIAREALQLSLRTGDPMITACMVQHLAMAAALRRDFKRSALLLGFVIAQVGSANPQTMRLDIYFRARLTEMLAQNVPQPELDALLETGNAWDQERAIEEALAVV
jgi:predicted ATPase/DNA-binding XRE family transcriptional regulator